jgi:uncharacterized membrane protein
MKKVVNYFLQGLLFTVPFVVTFYVIIKGVVWIDGLLPFKVPVQIPGIESFYLPGLGILIIFSVVTVIGYFGSRFVANPVFQLVERVLEKTPLLKLIYSSVKDLIEAFVGEKKRFNHPVLVTVNKESNIQRIGFITQNDLTHLGLGVEKMAVYFPFSYGFNGQLFIVPSANIEKLDASGTEMMKFIISGGVTEIENSLKFKV